MIDKRSQILAILSTIESTSYSDVQSPDKLLEHGFRLTGWIAFSAECIAEAKEALHRAREQAYINLAASLGSQSKQIGVLMMKDFCNDKCAKENAYLALTERCNAACTHANSLVITAISYLKTEMQNLSYAGR